MAAADQGGVRIGIKAAGGQGILPRGLDDETLQDILMDHLEVAADSIGGMAERQVKEGPAGDRLDTRRGTLKGSIRFDVFATSGPAPDVEIHVGPDRDVPYARIQELGGVIRPVNVKWLTIPLDAALTASGVADKPARSFENTFLVKIKDADGFKMFIMQRAGDDDDEIVPLFQLVKRVKLPATHWLSGPIEELESQGDFRRQWEDAMVNFVVEANRRGN